MLLYEANHLSAHVGVQELFSIAHLAITSGDRIGLVGRNGAGKSTLLRVLSGERAADGGEVVKRCGTAVIRQDGETGDESDARLRSLLGLRASAVRSGGERTRLAIASAFSARTPLLLADEPTTNLDLSGVETLQKLLLTYKGVLVLVSHDRALLDAVCTQIWELEDGALRVFPGTYSDWMEQKRRERDFAQSEYEKYTAEKKRLSGEMRSIRQEARGLRTPPRGMSPSEAKLIGAAEAAQSAQRHLQNRAKQLQKRIAHMEVRERPRDLPEISMPLGDPRPVKAKTAAQVEHVTVQYGSRTVLRDAALRLPTGSRTVLLGDNGVGKSTLVRALIEQGRFAEGVRVGYFSQGHETLDAAKTVLENARAQSDLPEHVVRTILANLYLGEREIGKPVSVLSGGERAKVMLARLLAARVHLLVLDEPTNHLDLYTLEALEELLRQWQGTLLVVTHDRTLTAQIADRLVFVKDGRATAFEGGLADWEAEQRRLTRPRDHRAERRALLEVRMAAINARLSCPRKGDDPEALRREWERLLAECRSL
ncbi:MAG: ribosomal protection-like ABC-F family protein [Intestinibacillus sp.]